MAAPTRTSRDQWIGAGLAALAAGGPDAVRIEPLAQTLGVTKGGFYWHFDGRRAFLDAMLDTWERRNTDDVIERAEREGTDPESRARRAGALTFGDELWALDLAVRDWSRRDPAIAERLRRVDNRRMEYLRTQLGTVCDNPDELEARCLTAFAIAIGNHLIAADHGSRSRLEVLDRVASRLFAP